jgi:hypothetical protein
MYRAHAFWLAALTAAACLTAFADNFAKVYFDGRTDRLVVTMSYRGTNPNHNFTLKWGDCVTREGKLPGVTGQVLDDQWNDAEQRTYTKTVRFNVSDLPCARPARVTLRSAPRFFYTLTIPK